MKLAKEKLRQIIKEELDELIKEQELEESEKEDDKKDTKKKKKSLTPPPKAKKRDPFDPSRYEDGEYRFDYDESDREKDYDW